MECEGEWMEMENGWKWRMDGNGESWYEIKPSLEFGPLGHGI